MLNKDPPFRNAQCAYSLQSSSWACESSLARLQHLFDPLQDLVEVATFGLGDRDAHVPDPEVFGSDSLVQAAGYYNIFSVIVSLVATRDAAPSSTA